MPLSNKIADAAAACPSTQDLQEVSNKFATSSIQLRFTFMRGLHPFYPPRVEVVRPHLSTPLPGALASHPLLRLEHWDPTLTMTELVDNIRIFLEVPYGGAAGAGEGGQQAKPKSGRGGGDGGQLRGQAAASTCVDYRAAALLLQLLLSGCICVCVCVVLPTSGPWQD